MPSTYRVRSVGLSRDPVLTKGGLRILPDLAIEDLSPAHRVITAPATASLEFPKHVLEKLQVYSPAATEAWYSSKR